jgi:hypothetical protein
MDLSPYHLPMQIKPVTDIFLCCEEQHKYKYHSRKMIAKLREVYAYDPMFAFYREFSSKMYS